MKTTFFPELIAFEQNQIHPYVFLGFAIFWFALCFVGFLLPSSNSLKHLRLPFTILTFFPFGFLCFSDFKGDVDFHYKGEISKENQSIRFGDDKEYEDITLPLSEFKSYVIDSKYESKDKGSLYTDTIYLRHTSNLLVPIGMSSVRKYTNKPFSRYAELSRVLRRFLKFYKLPIETIFFERFDGLLVDLEAISGEETSEENSKVPKPKDFEPKQKLEPLQFPVRWAHKVGSIPYYFLFLILAIGHLGILLTLYSIQEEKAYGSTFLKGVSVAIFGYVGAALLYYFLLYENSLKTYEIQKTTSGYELRSKIQGKPSKLEATWIQGGRYVKFLQFYAHKGIDTQSEESYRSQKALTESVLNGELQLSENLRQVQSIAQESKSRIHFNLSDLPIEVAVRFFLVLD